MGNNAKMYCRLEVVRCLSCSQLTINVAWCSATSLYATKWMHSMRQRSESLQQLKRANDRNRFWSLKKLKKNIFQFKWLKNAEKKCFIVKNTNESFKLNIFFFIVSNRSIEYHHLTERIHRLPYSFEHFETRRHLTFVWGETT